MFSKKLPRTGNTGSFFLLTQTPNLTLALAGVGFSNLYQYISGTHTPSPKVHPSTPPIFISAYHISSFIQPKVFRTVNSMKYTKGNKVLLYITQVHKR